MNILVIQSSSLDPVGVFGEHLIRQGATLCVWLVEQQSAPPAGVQEGAYEGLIVLGGPMNAHEDESFPHLRQTVELIQKFHREHKPIIGICLGAQLIARAFGTRVFPHRVPELGFSAVRTVDSQLDSEFQANWLRSHSTEWFFMQWHFDTFELPAEATLLMTSEVCKHQAYRIGENIYGFQFHFEVTPEIVMNWLEMKNDWIEANYPHLDSQIRDQVERYGQQSAQFAQQVAKHWLALFPSAVLT